jgi:MarR family transcriptional regulator, organic hydroperoxide resistance regulator
MPMAKSRQDVSSDPALRTVSAEALLVDGSDHAFRRMIHALMAIGHSLDVMREGFARVIGTTGPQHELIMLIYRYNDGEGISVGELAALVKLTSAFVATETSKLSGLGLIEKVTDPLDRRRVILRVTDIGRRKLALLSGYQRQGNDVLFECFDEKAFLKFSRLVEEVLPCGERAATLVTRLSQEKHRSDRKVQTPGVRTRAVAKT